MDDTAPITQAEMFAMFGESMPMDAVRLVWNFPGDKTVGELRAELRKIAREQKSTIAISLLTMGSIDRLEKVEEPVDDSGNIPPHQFTRQPLYSLNICMCGKPASDPIHSRFYERGNLIDRRK